jgi:hypothetical protein
MPSSAPTTDAAATPSAAQIYHLSVLEMRMLAKSGAPPYLIYDLHVDSHNLHWYPVVDHGVADWDAKLVHANEIDDYRVWYRSKDQTALVQDDRTLQTYRGDPPFAPDVEDLSDAHGGPHPSPTPTPAGDQSNGMNASQSSSQVIGAVTVDASRYYDVSLLGIEQRDGAPVYHLHLRAIRDPLDNPLTDMWVDVRDYRVWAVHGTATIRAIAAGFGVDVDADWADVDHHWLVSSIDFTGKGYLMLWHVDIGSAMTTNVVQVPASLPDSYFPSPTPAPSATPHA